MLAQAVQRLHCMQLQPSKGQTFSTAFCPHLQAGARAAVCGSSRRKVRLIRASPATGCAFTVLLLGICISPLATNCEISCRYHASCTEV